MITEEEVYSLARAYCSRAFRECAEDKKDFWKTRIQEITELESEIKKDEHTPK